jgi:hypothetical protein
MIWKFVSIGMFLWLLESVFHLSVGLIFLVGVAGVMGLVTRTLVISRRLAEVRRLPGGAEG